MGHHVDVETQGAEGTRRTPRPGRDRRGRRGDHRRRHPRRPGRFAGKPMHAVSTAEAIRHTARVISDTVGAVAAAAGDVGRPDRGRGVRRRRPLLRRCRSRRRSPAAGKLLVGITSCPTGIAHTFMAAEGSGAPPSSCGHAMKVETQGSVGAKNVLTAEEIAAADAVVIAADTKVDLVPLRRQAHLPDRARRRRLKHGDEVIGKALASNETLSAAAAGAAGGGEGPTARSAAPAASSGWRGVPEGRLPERDDRRVVHAAVRRRRRAADRHLLRHRHRRRRDCRTRSPAGCSGIGSAALRPVPPGARRVHRLRHRRPAGPRAGLRRRDTWRAGQRRLPRRICSPGSSPATSPSSSPSTSSCRQLDAGPEAGARPAAAGDAGHRPGHLLHHRRAALVGADRAHRVARGAAGLATQPCSG